MASKSNFQIRFFEYMNLHPEILLIAIAILLPFALFLNLGMMPLLSDEPTRGIVTLEMILSGNYITPTINGEFYYNKPPLYNWILAGFVHLTGSSDEFILRLPTILSLVLTGIVIYFFSRKSIGKLNSVLVALMYVASARILFWDSFQGLIDITYTLVTLGSFAALYHLSVKQKYLAMFVITYALSAIGFLMKGLPSLAFQAISLVVWLTHEKAFKRLFSLQHLTGIVTFLLITGSYYFTYLQSNSLQDVFSTLLSESDRLSDNSGSFLNWTSPLVIFPFEMIYEFAPWTLLLLLLFTKNIRKNIVSDKFIRFCMFIFASNILIYWISADMRHRYIFMLYPLLLVILVKANAESLKIKSGLSRFINHIFTILGFLGAFSILAYLYWDETRHMQGIRIVVPLLFIIAFGAAFLSIKLPQYRIMLLIIVLLSVRTGFNAFNLPARYNSYPDAAYRQGEIMAGRLSIGYDLYILGDTPINHDASFYITRERMHILTRTWEIKNKPTFYIADEKNLANFANRFGRYEVYKRFTIKLNETKLYLVKSK